MKKATPDSTPLALAVKHGKNKRVSPIDILKLARSHWLKGKKISIDKLAKENGCKPYHRISLGGKQRLVDRRSTLIRAGTRSQ